MLPVSDGHSLYIELCGNPQGSPAVVLHGGPGAGCSPEHRRLFDPSRYRIILLDQRGAGRSLPLGSVHANTTNILIGDIETVREHLGIGQWLVFGGSWGFTLALAYAAAHAENCHALVLRGIWLARAQDLHWKWTSAQMVHPEYWREFVSLVPSEQRGDLVKAYHVRLFDPDPAVHLPADLAWHRFEMRRTTLLPRKAAEGEPLDCPPHILALCRIEAHYFLNRAFLGDRSLIDRVAHIGGIPGTIIHGRYDMLCPVEGAATLSAAWPKADFTIIPDAGHSTFEPGIQAALVAATNRFGNSKPWH
jgi:proline iminopeptidase